MHPHDPTEDKAAYARLLIAFSETSSIVFAFSALGTGTALLLNPALANIPNLFFYVGLGLLVTYEFVTKKFTAYALANGTHPNAQPHSAAQIRYAQSVLRPAVWIDRVRMVLIFGGLALVEFCNANTWVLVGIGGITLGMLLMALTDFWYFVRTWMWECLVLAAGMVFTPVFLLGYAMGYFTIFPVFFFGYGALKLVGTAGLFLRWRAWAKTVRQEPTELDLEGLGG